MRCALWQESNNGSDDEPSLVLMMYNFVKHSYILDGLGTARLSLYYNVRVNHTYQSTFTLFNELCAPSLSMYILCPPQFPSHVSGSTIKP
jgi:hypothetical protein